MEQVIKDILKGKKGAATVFYREYSPKLRRFLVAKLPSEADAEELLQDIFLSVFDSLPIYRGECSVISWIYSIARHEVADFYRKRFIREAVERTSPLFENMVSETLAPEFVYEKNKIEKKFFGVYRGLAKQYQDVLSYRYELSMSVKDIALRMDLSFKATESLLYRARLAFRTEYERE